MSMMSDLNQVNIIHISISVTLGLWSKVKAQTRGVRGGWGGAQPGHTLQPYPNHRPTLFSPINAKPTPHPSNFILSPSNLIIPIISGIINVQ